MKTTSLWFPALLAVFLVTPHVLAEEGPSADTVPKKAETKKKVKPHSHLQEKTGVPVKEKAEPAAEEPKKDKKKLHLHPRDGK